MVLLVGHDNGQGWHGIHVEVIDEFVSLVAVDPVEENSADGEVVPHSLLDHGLQDAARLVPARTEQHDDDLVSCCGA